MVVNKEACEAGRLAQRLADGYHVHCAALFVAADPRSVTFSPKILNGLFVPVGFVRRKDGTEHVFHFTHYLKLAQTNPEIMADLKRVWLAASLLAIGDALA